MKNLTKEWLMKEAEATINTSFIDSLLFYMQEYREYFSYLEIAEIFSQTVDKMAKKVAEEMQENDEAEDE